MTDESQPPAPPGVLAILGNAARALVAFPGPAVFFFVVVTAWNCYGSFGEASFGDLSSITPLTPFVSLAGSLLIGWLLCGVARIAIAGARGKASTWNDTLVSGPEYFHAASALGAWITLILLGLLFMGVPAIFAYLIWCVSFFCAIDCRETWTAAMGHSRRITRGHWGLILRLTLVIGLLPLLSEVLLIAELWNATAGNLDQLLEETISAAAKSTPQHEPIAAAALVLFAALGAAVSTTICYIGAALYVALQDPPPEPAAPQSRSAGERPRATELPRAWPTSR